MILRLHTQMMQRFIAVLALLTCLHPQDAEADVPPYITIGAVLSSDEQG